MPRFSGFFPNNFNVSPPPPPPPGYITDILQMFWFGLTCNFVNTMRNRSSELAVTQRIRLDNISVYQAYRVKVSKVWWWRHQMEPFSALLALCAGNSPHKGQWRGALIFSLICAWINDWVNNREAGDLRRYRAHHDIIVMYDKLKRLVI